MSNIFRKVAGVSASAVLLNRVTFISPGGNDTAIVWDKLSRDKYVDIARDIQLGYPNIEQVMFAEYDNTKNLYRGQMAGGEYCGNATRALGYLIAGGKDAVVELDVSGADGFQTVIIKDGMAKTSVPILSSEPVIVNEDGEFFVQLGGISHLVSFRSQKSFELIGKLDSVEKRREYIFNILSNNMMASSPAIGVMLVDNGDRNSMGLDPYVFVRKTGTLYNETACGSGTAAVAMAEAYMKGNGIDSISLVQPSGMIITSSVSYDNKKFGLVQIDGLVSILYDGVLNLSSQNTKQKAGFYNGDTYTL